jgi:hypothetical protein
MEINLIRTILLKKRRVVDHQKGEINMPTDLYLYSTGKRRTSREIP